MLFHLLSRFHRPSIEHYLLHCGPYWIQRLRQIRCFSFYSVVAALEPWRGSLAQCTTESCPSRLYASVSSGVPCMIWSPSSILGSTTNKYVGLLDPAWLVSQLHFLYWTRMRRARGVVA